MSAPASLACSKLLHPETEESKTRAEHISMDTGFDSIPFHSIDSKDID